MHKTEAEKFATVFRAAADGIASPVLSHRDYIEGKQKLYDAGHPNAGWTYEQSIRHALTLRGDIYRLAQYDAFSSIATMYEKIVEAEKSTHGEGSQR